MLHPCSPLQVFRFCPVCGQPELFPDSEKSIKCKHCNFIYFLNMNGAVAVVLRNENDEILFTIRKHDPAKGMFDLPGGFIDPDETAEQAVVREIKEELNIEIESLNYLFSTTNSYVYEGIEYKTIDFIFEATVKTFATMQAADDVEGYIFRKTDEISLSEIGLPSIRQVIERLIEKKVR